MPQGSVDRYSTWELDEIVFNISPVYRFLLDRYFPTIKQFTTEFIEWDIVEGGHRVAPFVSPLALGKSTRRTGYRTYQMKPAYIKLDDTVHPTEGFVRTPGEPYGGNKSPQQRVDEIVVEKIALHLEMIKNRLELMARDAMFDGQIVVSGESYPAVTVNFGRNANNAATAAMLWNAVGSTPLADIQSHAETIRNSSRGAIVNELVMNSAIYDRLMRHNSVRELVNRDANLSPMTKGLDFGPRDVDKAPKWRGNLNGAYDLWTYDGYFEDDTGTEQAIMPANKVLFVANGGVNSGVEGRRYNGAILDLNANLEPREVFVKAKDEFEPSGVRVVTQSAPMVAPRRPNTTGTLTVL